MGQFDSSSLGTAFGEKYAKRVVAAMLYSPSIDGNKFRRTIADEISDEYVTDIEVSDGSMFEWDYLVEATVDLSGEDRDVSNTRVTDLLDFEVSTFWGLKFTDDGRPCVKFRGEQHNENSENKTANISIIVKP